LSEDEEIIQILLKRLKGDDCELQWEACINLANQENAREDKRIINALVEALGSNYALTRAHAAEGLGKLEIKEKEIAEKLRLLLKDKYRLTRAYSARALGILSDEDSILALIERLEKDDYFGVRAEAAEALRKICEGNITLLCDKARQALDKTAERKKKKIDERKLRVIMESQPDLKNDLADVYEHLRKAKMIIEENSAKMQEIERKSSQKGYVNKKEAAIETRDFLGRLIQPIEAIMARLPPRTTS
jgi:HEAT repeat protein